MLLAPRDLAPGDGENAPERRSVGRRVREAGLAIFFVSIALNAALGIYALLAPHFGATQGKVLGTSMCVTGAVLVALACEPAWERGLLGLVPSGGAVLGALGFALAIAGMWLEPAGDVYGRVLGTVFVASAACTAASLLALASLAPRHRWIFTLTLALLTVAATMLAVVWWLGTNPSTVYLRAMGIVLVAFAAFAVTVPVLHWIDRGVLAAARAVSNTVAYCPFCGGNVTGEVGRELRCARCEKGFTIAQATVTGAALGLDPLRAIK